MDGPTAPGTVILVANDAVIRADLAETLTGAGYRVEGFPSHGDAATAVASGAMPMAAVFDTPRDRNLASELERMLCERGIPFLRLTSDSADHARPDSVIEYPFSPLQILDGLRQRLV